VQALEEYESFLERENKVSANTRESYARDLTKFLNFLKDEEGDEDPGSVGGDVILKYLSVLQGKSMASSTISRSLASIRSFYKFLQKTKRIKDNPTSVVKPFRVEKKTPQILTTEEITLLLSQPKCVGLKGYRDKAMLELLYATGIRVSELINLLVEDINLEEGFLTVKKEYKERVIPVYPGAVEAVKNYIEKSRPMLVQDNDEPCLFVNCNGTKLTRQGFWKIIKTYKDMSGITKDITPHTLRHTFAVHLLENCDDLRSIQQMLGHTDISSTNMYAQLAKEHLNDVYQKSHPMVEAFKHEHETDSSESSNGQSSAK
jgi:integrase/recombinase XerD